MEGLAEKLVTVYQHDIEQRFSSCPGASTDLSPGTESASLQVSLISVGPTCAEHFTVIIIAMIIIQNTSRGAKILRKSDLSSA